jgi:hypothetical protein
MKQACVQSAHVSARCDVCGERPEDALHLPENLGGFYCQRHCPICSPVAATADNAAHQPEAIIKPQPLPAACTRCAPHSGAWAYDETGAMRRCDCPRGRQLSELDARHDHMRRWRQRPPRKSVAIPRDRDYKSMAAGGDR